MSESSVLIVQHKEHDTEMLIDDESLTGQNKPRYVIRKNRNPINSIILFISCMLNLVLLVQNYSIKSNVPLYIYSKGSLSTSPIAKDIKLQPHIIQFNGSFFKETIYRQDPSPEVDRAWADLGAEDAYFTVPEEDGATYGLLKNYHARLAPDEGHGFIAASEAEHHLHCLNMLRKSVWFNYEYYRDREIAPFGDSDDTIKAHTTHCIDTLRQQLICQPNLNIFGQVWLELEKNKNGLMAFPDFNTKHQCVDWNAIKAWIDERKYERVGLEYRKNDFIHREVP